MSEMSDEILSIEAEIADEIEAQYADQLAAARAQLQYARDTTLAWEGGRKPIIPKKGTVSADQIILLEHGRATKSYWASIRLAASGFAEQAMMVNRSLIEGMVVAHWVSINEQEAEERFVDALRYETHETASIYCDLGWRTEDEFGDNLLSEQEAESLAADYKWKFWTGHKNIPSFLDEIENLWEEESVRNSFKNFFRVTYRDANKILHADPTGIAGAFRSFNEQVFRVVSGPEPKDVNKALFVAFRAFSEMFTLIMLRFGVGDKGVYSNFYVDWQSTFDTRTFGPFKGSDRNEDCPCGSGRKVKHCHGR